MTSPTMAGDGTLDVNSYAIRWYRLLPNQKAKHPKHTTSIVLRIIRYFPIPSLFPPSQSFRWLAFFSFSHLPSRSPTRMWNLMKDITLTTVTNKLQLQKQHVN